MEQMGRAEGFSLSRSFDKVPTNKDYSDNLGDA